MVVLVRPVPAVVHLVAEPPARDAHQVVAAELGLLGALDRLTHERRLVGRVAAIVIAITAPFPRDTDLKTGEASSFPVTQVPAQNLRWRYSQPLPLVRQHRQITSGT